MKYSSKDHCKICGRELGETNVDFHHLIPKTHGGKEIVPLHKICHRKIHSLFTEKELEKKYYTPELLLANEEMKIFVAWVKGKALDFYSGSDNAKRKR